jgi:putative ISPg5, transposase orf1
MFKYNCAKRTKYYDDVIRLHTQEGMGQKRISKIIPVSESTIKRWIRNFVRETKVKEVVMKEQVQDSVTLHGSQRDTDVKALQAEIARLKKELAHESLKSAAFNEMINVAEKQFNISIRKKAGTRQ